jgi:hypothetical protein
MHFCRAAQSEALQDRPSGDVLPPTADYTDLVDSRVAKAWIEDQSDPMKLDYDTKLARATWWSVLCGNGYLKWLADMPNGKFKPCLIAPSFFEVLLDPYAKTFDDGRYIIHTQFMDVEQVYDKYGVEAQATSQTDEARTALLRGMGCAPALSGAVVNELWQKPSRRYPQGRYAVWTGRQQLIAPDKLPYKHLIEERMLPFTQLGIIERGDSPYYLSPVQYLRPAQMELNVAHNQAFTLRRNFANGKVFLPDGLELAEPWDQSTGQVLKGLPGAAMPGLKPEIIQPLYSPLSPDIDLLEQGMMHIVGQHEVSQAQVPGRVEAAKAIELLRESDAGALAVLRKTTEVSNSVGWWQMLMLAREFQTEADAFASYSKEGIPEVKHFRAGDMSPGFRIRTTMTTGLARSRTNRQELVMRLIELKVLDVDRDQETIAELLETPLPNTTRSHADDIMLARNENLTLAAGTAVQPDSWNDHATHILEHDKYRNTAEYQASSPDVKQKFENHCTRHRDMQEEQIKRQAFLQMLAQGGQPPTPNPAVQPAAAEPQGA